jgi:hypothetical protein
MRGGIVAGSGRVALVAQVLLGVTTHQLTFVTSNRTLDSWRNPCAFVFGFIDYAHPSSYAPGATKPHLFRAKSGHLIASKKHATLCLSSEVG